MAAALAEQLPPLLDAHRPVATPATEVAPETERIVGMRELCERLGVNRTTVLRKERQGKVPRRRQFPDGQMGWLSTEIDAWLKGSPRTELSPTERARLASRIHRAN